MTRYRRGVGPVRAAPALDRAGPRYCPDVAWSDLLTARGADHSRVGGVAAALVDQFERGAVGRGVKLMIVSSDFLGPYHDPVFGIDTQGSCGGRAAPFCRSSTEILSGERTKAMRPSRGGRLIVTP